jgi:DNA-binding GntR family transcriptional regulator
LLSSRGENATPPVKRPLRRVKERPKLGEEITAELRQAILSGAFEQGQRLGLEEVAEQLGVSAMPVREALITLASEGFVTALPRRGFRVETLARQDLDDLFAIHAHLSGILAARAAASIAAEDLARLKELHAELVRLDAEPVTPETAAQMNELNVSFHRLINKLPPGNRIRWFLRLTSKFIRNDLYEASPGWRKASIIDHPKIIAALEAHDSEAARRLVESHLLQGIQLIPGGLPAEAQDEPSLPLALAHRPGRARPVLTGPLDRGRDESSRRGPPADRREPRSG